MSAPLKIRRRQPHSPEPEWPEDMPALLRRIYTRRGITDARDLQLGLNALLPYHGLKGIQAAAELLHQALIQDWHILVVGDFDADGATASALAVQALQRFGAGRVSYIVPDRFLHGYGLTPEIVALAAQQQPDLIITVDNGIASIDGVRDAKALGMRVLITDHHLPGALLPDADAIVNPNQPGCEFGSRNLAGVGVVFYVMAALRAHLREQGWFEDRALPSMAEYLDLVALGTVADVVPLDHNNRVLVAQGLQRIRGGYARPGIRALAQAAGRDFTRLAAEDIGFGLAPRLNAAGRMQDMRIGIDCLLARTDAEALDFARELNTLNVQRCERQQEMEDAALAALGSGDASQPGEQLPAGLCLHQSDWHEGIVGLVAGKLRERHFRPAVAFARTSQDDGMLKGSARSIPGVHIRDVMAAINARHPALIERFGGHAMAAGLSLREDNFEAFASAFSDEILRWVTPDQLENVVETDGALDPEEFNLASAGLLRDAGPWGQHFEPPSFDGTFGIVDQRIVGQRHLKLRVQPVGSDRVIEAIAFNQPETLPQDRPAHLVYRLDVNEYQGLQSAQLIVNHVL